MSTPKICCVYMMTNPTNTVLYTGVTSNLPRRAHEHRNKRTDGFTSCYNCTKLVYYEVFDGPLEAITREKQIKAGSRRKKNGLVNGMNPDWKDLADTL